MAGWGLVLHTADTERAIRRLKDRAPLAIARALNRTAANVTTVMIRAISADTGIKQKDLRGTTARNRTIWSREATPQRQLAVVQASTERIPLIDFQARGPEPSRGRGRGVTAKLIGGARRYPRAFIATMASGHRGVYQRASPAAGRSTGAWSPNLPIHELHGPSIARVWEKHAETAQQRAAEQLPKNLAAEFRFATRTTT